MFLVFSPFCFWDFGSSLLSLLWILFQVGCLFHLHLFDLVGFYLAPLSNIFFFFLMGRAVFLSYWLFGLRCSELEFAGSWIEPGLGVKMRISLWLIFPGVWGSLLVQQFGLGAPTTGPQVQPLAWEPRSTSHMVWQKKERKKKRSNTITKNKKQNKITKIKLY